MQRGLSPQGVTVMITEGGAKPVCPQVIAKANPKCEGLINNNANLGLVNPWFFNKHL